MPWVEVTFTITEKQAEDFSEKLEILGALAVSFLDASDEPLLEPLPGTTPLWRNVKMVGLFAGDTDKALLQQTLNKTFPNLSYTLNVLADQEWSRTWLEHFRPMRFGQHLWIIPNDDSVELPHDKKAVIVKLDPGLAFGTGTHHTTALCLTWLDAHPPQNKTVIDYGCGSGILGIAALKLGAEKVLAVDYDPQALLSTQENAARNEVSDKIIAYLPEKFPASQADVVLANILAEPLISLAPTLRQCCKMGGVIVLSGLLANQVAAVKVAYEKWFSFDAATIQEDWALLAGTRIL
ncbi:MAG: 50S ribosomal protein L11 methyltransferase [Candidatus Berkiellales bacterium]